MFSDFYIVFHCMSLQELNVIFDHFCFTFVFDLSLILFNAWRYITQGFHVSPNSKMESFKWFVFLRVVSELGTANFDCCNPSPMQNC